MYSEAENIIINRFGIPEIEGIEKEYLTLKTNDKKIPGTDEEDFLCEEGSYKFCLVKEKNELPIEPIFIMDFFKSNDLLNLLRNSQEEPAINLELLWVKDTLRKKKIATYYIQKLVQYAKEEGFTQINIRPNPHASNFKNDKKALNEEQLISFYKTFEDKDIKINIKRLNF